MKEAAFESLGFDMENSHAANCYKCGEPWHRFHPVSRKPQIHTEEEGWIPLSKIKPPDQPVEQPKPKIIV